MLKACKTEKEVFDLSRNGQKAFAQLEQCPKPVVAAIMGACMGGGFEVINNT